MACRSGPIVQISSPAYQGSLIGAPTSHRRGMRSDQSMRRPPYDERTNVPPKRLFAEFASGLVFGAALFGSGVYAPNVIKAQMAFTSNTMITVMMGASASSAIVQDLGDRFKLLPKKYLPPRDIGLFPYDANAVGGALIGLGMGLTGACPGTALVQAGAGMTSGCLVLVGEVLGAMAFLQLQSRLDSLRSGLRKRTPRGEVPAIHSPESSKPLDIATALRIHPFVLLMIWVPMCVAVMRLAFAKDGTVRQIPASGVVPPVYGGLLIGFAQLITLTFAGHTIGASAAYGDIARWVADKSNPRSNSQRRSLLTPSVMCSVGVIASAAISSRFVRKSRSLDASFPHQIGYTTALLAILGGFLMMLGARLAGGCTSGHGISGLARFSIPSLVTTAALFAGGIVTIALLGG